MSIQRKRLIIIIGVLILLAIVVTGIILRNNYLKHKHPLDLKLWTYSKEKDEYTYESADVTQDLEIDQSVRITDKAVIINIDSKTSDKKSEKLKEAIKEGKHVNSNIPCPYNEMNIYNLFAARDQDTEYADRKFTLNYTVNNEKVRTCSYTKEEIKKVLSDPDKIAKDVEEWFSLGITEEEKTAEKEMEALNKTITDESSFSED